MFETFIGAEGEGEAETEGEAEAEGEGVEVEVVEGAGEAVEVGAGDAGCLIEESKRATTFQSWLSTNLAISSSFRGSLSTLNYVSKSNFQREENER